LTAVLGVMAVGHTTPLLPEPPIEIIHPGQSCPYPIKRNEISLAGGGAVLLIVAFERGPFFS
jgi:hypothetical protein